MPQRHPYRTAHQTVSPPARPWWVIVPLWACAVVACLAIVAGTFLSPVLSTIGLHTIVLLTVLAPAAMLGLALSVPFRDLCSGSPWPDGFRLVLALALGLGALSLATLGVGSAELLGVWAGPILLLAGALVGAGPTLVFIRTFDRAILRRPIDRRWLLILFTALPTAVLLVSATFPPGTLWRSEGGGYDVLEYHLAAPRDYALAGNTHPLAGNVYSYLPANVEMLYTLLMVLAKFIFGPENLLAAIYPAQLLHCTFMLLTAAAIVLLPIRMRLSGRLLAAAFFLAIPWIIVTGSEAYDEGGVLLFGTLALGFALGQTERKDDWRRAVAIGVLLGLCVGSKMTAGVMIAVPVALVLLIGRRWKEVAIASVLAVVVYSPWAIRSVAAAGNPVFPVAASTLGRGPWDQTLVDRFVRGHSALVNGIGGRFAALLEQTVMDPQYSPGVERISQMLHSNTAMGGHSPAPWIERVGFLWLLAPVVLAIALTRGSTAWRAALILVTQIIMWLAFTHLQARFLLPAAPVIALLLGFSAETRLAPLSIAIVAFQSLTLGGLLPIEAPATHDNPGVWSFIGAATNLHGEDIWMSFAAQTPFPRDKHILLIGDARTLYLAPGVQASTVFDRNPLGDALRTGGPAGAMNWLRHEKFDMLVIDWNEVMRLRNTYGFDPAITPEAIAALEPLGLQRTTYPARSGIAIYEITR